MVLLCIPFLTASAKEGLVTGVGCEAVVEMGEMVSPLASFSRYEENGGEEG